MEIWRADELEVHRGLSSELDEMWSYVHSKANPRWLWHAIDHHTGKVLAYVFGRRKDTVFLKLKALLEPFGITRYFTDYYHRSQNGSCPLFVIADYLEAVAHEPGCRYSCKMPSRESRKRGLLLNIYYRN